jgi:hypothetical protein
MDVKGLVDGEEVGLADVGDRREAVGLQVVEEVLEAPAPKPPRAPRKPRSDAPDGGTSGPAEAAE